jgi:long-chain fatty acid transport protein
MMLKLTPPNLVLAACLSCIYGTSQATDVFRLEGYGPVSRAMGGTATAYDVGAGALLANPATLSLTGPGSRLHVGLDLVNADIDVRNRATGETASSDSHSKNRGPYVAPELAYVWSNGPLTLAAGAFAQGGLGTEYGRNSFLSRTPSGNASGLEMSSRLLVLDIPFALSYKVNDRLSIGASLDALWTGLNLNLLFGGDQVGALIGAGRVQGSLLPVIGGLPAFDGAHVSFTKNQPVASGAHAWGIGGRVGVTYAATERTTVGVSYQFESDLSDLEGKATVTALDRVVGQVALPGNVAIRDFQMPAVLSIGVGHKLGDQWRLTADLSEVYWKHAMKDINVHFVADAGVLDLRLPQDYKDQTIFAVGAAYTSGPWTYRGGARVASQALRPDLVFAVIPATPRKHLTAGVAYALAPGATIDVAYSHAFRERLDNPGVPNTSAPISVSNRQDNLAISYTHQF